MEDNGQIIIDVQMDALIASLQELKKQYDENTAALKALDKESETYEADSIKLQQEQKVLRQEMSGVEKQIQNTIKIEKAQEDSLVQLRAKLANLNKQYDSMSGIDRMGKSGQELQAKIKGLSDQIVGLEGATGRWQRNVGNYQSALSGLSTSFKSAGIATGGLDKSLKLLNANPIVLFLTAIVTVIRAIVQAFKRNEEATMGLREAFSAFNPILDLVKKGFDALANLLVNVVTKAVEGLTTALGWLLKQFQTVANFFGADAHFADNFNAGVEAARELTKSEKEYIKAKRAYSVESARIDREVADLREKATDKERYSAQQRLEFLDQAIALETEKAEKEKKFAEWNLRNLQAEAARSANSAEMNDRLAEAERAVIEADTNLSNTKRALSKQRQAAINETKGLSAATSKLADDVARLNEQYQKLTETELQKAEDALNELIEDQYERRTEIERTAYERKKDTLRQSMEAEAAAHGTETYLYLAYASQMESLETQHERTMQQIQQESAVAQLEAQRIAEEASQKQTELYWQNRINEAIVNGQRQGEVELEMLKERLETMHQYEWESDEEFRARQLQAQIEYNQKKQQLATADMAIEKAKADYTANIAKSMSDTMAAVAGDNEALVKASKIVALAEVAIKQGVAIASAIASSAEGDPYTYALRVASAIGTTIAAMAQAISSINQASFAGGGVVGNTFKGASMGQDNTYIHARNGELVLNAEQQRQLWEIANNRGAMPNVAEQLAEAIRLMPAPVLEYSEFKTFQNNILQYDEGQTIK